MKKSQQGRGKEKEVYVALYKGKHLLAWSGGYGTRIPVWETGREDKKEIRAFKKNNKYHKPVMVKATITYSLPKKNNHKRT